MFFNRKDIIKKHILKNSATAALCLSLAFFCAFLSFAADEEGRVYYKASSVSESGYAPIPFRSSYDNSFYNDGVLKKASSLPAKYDSREHGLVTAVKNQDIFGACWAFSAIGASESSLIKEFPKKYNKDNTDFSELHLSYFCFAEAYDKLKLTKGDWAKVKNDDYLNMGGNLYFASFTLARWFGIADEKVAPYEKAYTGHSLKAEDAYSHNEALLESAYWVPMKKTDEVKRLLMKYGACGISFYHDELYLNNSTGGYYQRLHTIGNHSATLVGWDDNYSRDNFGGILGFNIKPRKNGAWLVKNSYSEDIGDEGYFWVSYEDRSIYTDDAVFFDFVHTDTFDNNYQYDGTCAFATYYFKNKIYSANVFTAKETEKLTAISFFQGDSGSAYKYQIFKNIKDKNNLSKSGTAVFDKYQKIDIDYAGYNTIWLPEEIALSKGEKFAVVILTEKENGKAYAMCDYEGDIDAAGTITSHAYSEKGQSFMSKDGKNWEDIYGFGHNENFRIKAFTKKGYVKPDKLTTEEKSIKISVSETEKIKLIASPVSASDKAVWTSSDEKIATVTNSGKVTAKSIGKVTLSYVSKADSNIKGKITVKVVPDKVKDIKQISSKTNSVTVSWKKSANVTGYMVYKLNKKTDEKELVGKTKKNKFTLKDLQSGEKIKLYVSGYKDIKTKDGEKEKTTSFVSDKASVTVMTRPKKVKLQKKKATETTVALKWNKSKGATEYRVYLYDKENDEYELLKKTAKTEVTLKKLRSGKTYRFVVRARIYSGKSYYASADSNIVKVETLKKS